MKFRISDKWKAVYGALAAVGAFIGEALADNVVDIDEGVGFVSKLIAAGALIYAVVWAKGNKGAPE